MKKSVNAAEDVLFDENLITDLSKTSRCFKILVFVFRLSGAEVDYSRLNAENRRRQYLLLAWGLCCWLTTVSATTYLGVEVYHAYVSKSISNSSASFGFIGSVFVEYACIAFFQTGAHAAILANCTQSGWLKLWQNLHRVFSFKDVVKELRREIVFVTIYLFGVSESIERDGETVHQYDSILAGITDARMSQIFFLRHREYPNPHIVFRYR